MTLVAEVNIINTQQSIIPGASGVGGDSRPTGPDSYTQTWTSAGIPAAAKTLPQGELPQELIPLEEKQFMEAFRTEKAPGVPYNEADFPYLGPKQTFSSPGVSSDGVRLYDAYTGGVKPVEAQRMYRTPRTIGDQIYYSTSLPENNLRAELTDQQKRFIDKKKFALQENLISPESVYETITNPDLGVYDTGIFGFGAQEPTTEDEYNDYLQSIGVTAQV